MSEVEQLRREVNELRERIVRLESRAQPLQLFGDRPPGARNPVGPMMVGHAQIVPQASPMPMSGTSLRDKVENRQFWKDLPADGVSLSLSSVSGA